MEYLLGLAILGAFTAFRWFTASWTPRASIDVGRNRALAATYYAARSAISLALLALAFAHLLLDAHQTPALFTPVRGPLAVLPSAVGVLFSMLVLAQVAQANRLPEFLGLSSQRKVLFVKGMFSLCRHPMYAGWLLAIWGLLLSLPYALTLLFGSLLSLSIILEAIQEEGAMARDFGEYYRRYQAEVPFLVPFGFVGTRRPLSKEQLKPAAPDRPGRKTKAGSDSVSNVGEIGGHRR